MTPISHFYGDGLLYQLHPDPEPHYRLTAANVFVIDDVWYDYGALDEDAVYIRPMIELIDDDDPAHQEPAWIYLSAPPTDTELDTYVRDGYIPAPRPLQKGTPHHGHQTRRQ